MRKKYHLLFMFTSVNTHKHTHRMHFSLKFILLVLILLFLENSYSASSNMFVCYVSRLLTIEFRFFMTNNWTYCILLSVCPILSISHSKSWFIYHLSTCFSLREWKENGWNQHHNFSFIECVLLQTHKHKQSILENH